ncbi:DEAD/DEAH box helicase family protein [Actinoplanes sp. NPDC049802]|uniref:DEAD/DEAH box helicase n=1 Tax=Actinoplanes sp. NPDC049802 TaxID=3154742 RepID=UPI0033D8BAC2
MTQPSWTPDAGLVREVENLFDSTIASYRVKPDLISEHANHEESIRVGGYANRTLLELVQNAADAMSGTGMESGPHSGRVEIVLDTTRNILYCANAGRPFSKSGLTAITHAHLSGKRGDEIGRFGLGFKSVLAVSSAPKVFSRSVSFEFNSAEAQTAIHGIGSAVRRLPVLRTATVIDANRAFAEDRVLAELGEWASTIVKLPNVSDTTRLRKEIVEFSSEFLLFVSAVREVRLRILGSEPFTTSHVSRSLGSGLFKIEGPDGEGEEWIVEDRMHAPSPEARKHVGEAVSRAKVKVTVAIPRKLRREHRIGRFWSYFPLQDKTSASALFNAPWSVNDDRTTLLRNAYNAEILVKLSEMFVAMMPRVRTAEDAAAHLEYLPARGRELLSYGDEVLCAQVPHMAVGSDIVPDADGTLTRAANLKPLDFAIALDESIHKAWIGSPNTGSDVPHWQCYTSLQRVSRLRHIFAAANGAPLDSTEADIKRAVAAMTKKRGLLSWLREWAEGDDPVSAANALRLVCRQRNLPDVERAKVIPTTDGLRSLQDKNVVFLHQVEGLEIEGAVFVAPAFLSQNGIDKLLRDAGFRALDPLAILNARLARLSSDSSDEEHTRLWKAAIAVPLPIVQRALAAYSSLVKVPTRDGGWAWPREVIDIDIPLKGIPGVKALDRTRCLAGAAHTLGVIHDPVREYPSEDEFYFEKYRDWVLEDINANQGPGERPVERIEFYPGVGPGPFSMLFILRDAEASQQLRTQWTTALIQADNTDWTCDDVDAGMSYNVLWSPVRWAVENAGLVESTKGFRPPSKVVAPSMLRYELLLPLLRGGSQLAAALELPNELEAVPVEVLKEALGAELFNNRIPNEVLLEFILASSRIAYPDAQPPAIPAKIGHFTESRSPSTVFLATSDEQEALLKTRQRPYLRVPEAQVPEFVKSVGCRRFEDVFAFSILVEGEREDEPILDVFPGLRSTHVSGHLRNATLTRAVQVVKRVTDEKGAENQSIEWHLDGLRLIVRNESDEPRLLRFVNEAFDLGLTNADLAQVLKVGLDQRLEEERQRAKAATTDEERLDVYFGPDDLRDALPKGLWKALQTQGLVDSRTSVAGLFLTVWGYDSIQQLAQNFRDRGFSDVPDKWAGLPAAITWLRKMGFGPEFAGRRNQRQDQEFIVPGAVRLNALHAFQKKISEELQEVLTKNENGVYRKAMVELPTGAGKTRVATETVLRLFIDGRLRGPVLWIAQSQELCEQAVQTVSTVWRGLGDERPLTIGRLWDGNTVNRPETEFSFIVATDAQLRLKVNDSDYQWLSEATAVFIDEGHRAGGSEMYTRILSWLGVAGRGFARPLIGLSATPFKGTSIEATDALAGRFGRKKIKAFDEGNAYRELADAGVLARVQHQVLKGIDVNLKPGEQNDARTLRRISPTVMDRIGRDHARMSTLVNHILGLDDTWPVLVFTPDVLAAQVLAATLRCRDVTAAAVSGQTGGQERRDIINRFKNNEIRVLTNCDLLIQGFDAPGVRALYIARPTFSPNAYIQMAGRGLRGPMNGGKEECLIVDMADNFGDFTELLGYKEYEDLWQEHRS